jgi:hypothetical protein
MSTGSGPVDGPIAPVAKEAATRPLRRERPTPVRRGRHLPVGLFGALVVGVFAGVIGIGAMTGTWQTSGKTAAGGQKVAPAGVTVTEIKGWMTIGEVADAFAVPMPEILAEFQLPADTVPATAIKDLESDRFSVTALRDWIEARRAATP